MDNTKKKNVFKAIIFDMDGTMVDNMMVHHRAWQRKLKSLGMDLSIEEVMRDIHGVNDEIIKRLFGDRFNEKEIKQIAWEKEAAYREIYAEEVKLLDGLEAFLDKARDLDIPMGVGTAAPEENVTFILDKLDLHHYYKAVVHAGQVENGKPNPEVFEKVARQMDIPLEECLVFEDSPTGARAAQNGQTSCYVLTTTHKQEDFEGISAISGFVYDFSKLKLAPADQPGYFQLEEN